jgi:hypothetical protein
MLGSSNFLANFHATHSDTKKDINNTKIVQVIWSSGFRIISPDQFFVKDISASSLPNLVILLTFIDMNSIHVIPVAFSG